MKERIRAAYLKALLVFTGAVASCALVIWFGFGTGETELSLFALGLVFAGYTIGTRTLACQYRDINTALLVFWGASFGFWYPLWEGEVEHACLTWVQELWGLSEDGALNLVTPIALASAGLGTAALLSIATMSTAVFVQAIMLTVVATVASLAPEYNEEATAGGILLWHAGICWSLAHWAVVMVKRRTGTHCPFCGTDLGGLSMPVCPGCKRVVPRPAKSPLPQIRTPEKKPERPPQRKAS